MNLYFFEECTFPAVPGRENNISIPKDGKSITIMKGKLSDFDLQYEAYFLNNNKAYSDAVITNGIRWNIGMLNPDQLQAGDRVIILLHPIHWHRASVHASIQSFRLPGQRSVSIDSLNQKISVEMPYGTDKSSLTAVYTLSPGAYAKIEGKFQVSKSTVNNFNSQLIYRVYAENRDIQKEWTINVTDLKNSACDFLAFSIPGLAKSVIINTFKKSILVELNKDTDLKHLPVQFEISSGASAWIGQSEQFSNSGTIDFSGRVRYRILAEDRINSCIWTVIIKL
jgi:hypothetical protein